MFSFSSNERKYPDNEVRVAVFINPTGLFDYGYHDISKGEKPKVLDDIDQELWSKLCDYWPCPSRLQTTRYGSCWFYMFVIYFSISLCGLPYAILIRSPFYAGLSWSLYCVWTFVMFYSLKVVKRKIVAEFGPSTKVHIESLAEQFETEAGYIVDYGVDGSMVYARFQKLDHSNFEHAPPTNRGLMVGLFVMSRNLFVALLCVVLLSCPIGVLLLSELGTSALQQRITKQNTVHQGLNWPQVRFSQWTYFNPQYPRAQRVIFSSEQRASLGMGDNRSMVLKQVPARIAALGYIYFVFRAANLCWNNKDGITLERQRKSTWSIGAAAVCSCLMTVLALVPILELFEKSPLCGPHYVELPFERRYHSSHRNYRYYGIMAIFRDDIDANCVLGKDVYWQWGLGVLNLLFIYISFVRQRSLIRKRHLVAMTEANLSYVIRPEDCDDELHGEIMQAANNTDVLSNSTIETDDYNEDDPSPRRIV